MAKQARAKTAGGRVARRELLEGLAALAAMVTAAPGAWAEVKSPGRILKPVAKPPRIVVLDPGHGGIDPGTIGVSGVYEKEVVLEVATEVARRLEATRHYRVVLTRSSDEFIELRERVARARAAQGELFLSIHADALPNPASRGASVFTLSEKASDSEAAALAARENKADLIAGIDLSRQAPEVSNILLDLARRQTNNLSIGLARRLVDDLGQEAAVMLENSHRSAGFAVLKAPDIPSALVELGCLSNREEDRLLRSAAYQRRLATGLVRSVNDFFDVVMRA